MNDTVEFYSPFAHIPGRHEIARIHTTTHGSFDVWIVVTETTDRPVVVYVHDENGAAFMADRYPESTTIRVEPDQLVVRGDADGDGVTGTLVADRGPVRQGTLRFVRSGEQARAVPYGGTDFPVWGSRWRCHGVDLEIPAVVTGAITGADGQTERFDRHDDAVITLGSYGAIAPRG